MMKTLPALLLAAGLAVAAAPAIGPSPSVPAPVADESARAGGFDLVGHEPLGNRGMNAALAVHGDYAYVGSRTDGKAADENLLGAGVLVVDVSDPTSPEVVHEIGPPHQGTTDQTSREMRVWPQQDLLIVMNLASNCSELIHACSPTGGEGDNYRFYDIAGDKAAAPEFIAQYDPSLNPHEFFLWVDPADGNKALLIQSATSSNHLVVTDISGARNGEFNEVLTFPIPAPGGDLHSMTPSFDGSQLHLAYLTGGYLVADLSEVTDGDSRYDVELLTEVAPTWPGPGAHSAVPIPGQPDKVLITDEVYGEALRALGDHGCPWGWTRFVDIADPKEPQVISEFRLAENEATFCDTDVPRASSSYSAHNPTLTPNVAFITWHSGGLQAVSLADPAAPTQLGAFFPEPLLYVTTEDPALSAGRDKVVMWSFPIIQDGLIYVVDLRNGLYVLEYTGPHADEVAAIEFLEGNSNLGDALRF